jgi:hypothetical protein
MAKGGARPGAGRKKLKPEVAEGDKVFASRVLARIGKPGWREFADLSKVKSDEDYALYLLLSYDRGDYQFHKLLDRKYGKPVQRVRVGNPEGEKLKLEVDVTSVRNKLLAVLAG